MLFHSNNVITEVSPVPSWLLSRCESQSVSPCGVTTPFSGRPSGLCGVTTLLSPSHGLLATLLIERSQGSQEDFKLIFSSVSVLRSVFHRN